MSAGRRTVDLERLQEVARAKGGGTLVARLLLSEEVAMADVTREVQRRVNVVRVDDPPLLSSREVGYGVSADWQYRTTPEDIREDIAEMAKTRVGPFLAAFVDPILHKSFGDEDLETIGLEGLYRIKSMLERCRYEYMRSIVKPVKPSKPVKLTRMPVRVEGPCSPVVIRTRHGAIWCQGKALEESEVATALQVKP